MDRSPTWPIAAGSLIVGFGVADLTGVRALGGVVLFVACVWCALRWKERRNLGVALGLVAFYLVLFVLSHVLGHQIGAWPSVFVVSAAMAGATWAIADREPAAGAPLPAE